MEKWLGWQYLAPEVHHLTPEEISSEWERFREALRAPSGLLILRTIREDLEHLAEELGKQAPEFEFCALLWALRRRALRFLKGLADRYGESASLAEAYRSDGLPVHESAELPIRYMVGMGIKSPGQAYEVNLIPDLDKGEVEENLRRYARGFPGVVDEALDLYFTHRIPAGASIETVRQGAGLWGNRLSGEAWAAYEAINRVKGKSVLLRLFLLNYYNQSQIPEPLTQEQAEVIGRPPGRPSTIDWDKVAQALFQAAERGEFSKLRFWKGDPPTLNISELYRWVNQNCAITVSYEQFRIKYRKELEPYLRELLTPPE